MKQVQYVKYNKMRREQFQIKTQICVEDGVRFVEKCAVRPQGVEHIRRFADSYDLYNQFLADDLGFSICPDMEIFTQRAFSTPPYNFIRRPISDNVYSTIGYVYHKKRPKNQFIEYFLYFLNQV